MKVKSISILFIITLITFNCTSGPENKQETISKTSAKEKEPISQDDVSHLIPILWPGLETDMKLIIPVKMQDENGLFVWVDKESEFYNEKWNRGYAGMFPVGYNGSEVEGFKISLPMQIHGNWSHDYEDYFIRYDNPESPVHNFTRQHLYSSRLHQSAMEFWDYSPYYEFDKAYASMIREDESLTLEQKLELIIVNHKGFIENLLPNISPLIQDYISLNSVSNIISNKEYLIIDELIYLTIHPDMQNSENIDDFYLFSLASFKIVEYRLPQIFQHYEPAEDDFCYFRLSVPNKNPNVGGTASYYNRTSRIDYTPHTFEQPFERFFGTTFHEKIHYVIQSSKFKEISQDSALHKWLNNPSYNSEIITYGNCTLLAEVLNYSPILYRSTANTTWWGYGDMHYDGIAPLDKFIQIVDNQNGVARP